MTPQLPRVFFFFFASVQVCRAHPMPCRAHAALCPAHATLCHAHAVHCCWALRALSWPNTIATKGVCHDRRAHPYDHPLSQHKNLCQDSGFPVLLIFFRDKEEFCRDNPSIQQQETLSQHKFALSRQESSLL